MKNAGNILSNGRQYYVKLLCRHAVYSEFDDCKSSYELLHVEKIHKTVNSISISILIWGFSIRISILIDKIRWNCLIIRMLVPTFNYAWADTVSSQLITFIFFCASYLWKCTQSFISVLTFQWREWCWQDRVNQIDPAISGSHKWAAFMDWTPNPWG